MRTVCVVHLVWAPLGVDRFRQFLESYQRNISGKPHSLLIIFNGFAAPFDTTSYTQLLVGVKHRSLVLPTPVQDIEAYLISARTSNEDDFCFLNSYSVILHGDWLAKLHIQLNEGSVGLVGATGSWESMYSSWVRSASPGRGWTPRGLRARLLKPYIKANLRKSFPPFPNPHIRTNAFMIARTFLLSLNFAPVHNKEAAHRFESGREGLTARVVRAGVQPRVVDCNGKAWRPEEWNESRTFRSGRQENLLIADNRTSDFLNADDNTRQMLENFAWDKTNPS